MNLQSLEDAQVGYTSKNTVWNNEIQMLLVIAFRKYIGTVLNLFNIYLVSLAP